MRTRHPTGLLLALAAAACGPPSTWTGTSPDHRSRYTVSERDGLTCLERDDGTPRCYDGLSLQDIVFAPDSRRLAFPARFGPGWRVVVDEDAGPLVDGVGALVFAPDGDRLTYAALRDGSWHVVADDTFGPPVDLVYAGTLRFDPTGRHLAYAARVGDASFVSLDGRTLSTHEGVGALRFSPDGSRLGWVARDGGRAHLLVDGKVVSTHREVLDFHFAPSGEVMAWVSRESDGQRVHWPGEAFGPFPDVTDLTLAPGRPPAFVVNEGGRSHVRIGGEGWPGYAFVEAPVFAERGPRWGFIGSDSTQAEIFLDGQPHATEEWASDLRLSHDGTRFAYVALRAGLTYVVHDAGERGFDVVIPETLLFLPGEERWACLAGRFDGEELYVAVEGTSRTRPFDWSEAGRVLLGNPEGGEEAVQALRAWVLAEAALILEEKPGGP